MRCREASTYPIISTPVTTASANNILDKESTIPNFLTDMKLNRKTAYIIYLFGFLLLGNACNRIEQKNSFETLTFKKEKAIKITESIVSPTIDIQLDTASGAFFHPQAQMRMGCSNIFVFTKKALYRFNLQGHLLNRIGNLGSATNEYIEINDVDIDSKCKHVEVLTPEKINTYTVEGKFIEARKPETRMGICSFIRTGDSYWLSNGRNGTADYTVYVTDTLFRNKGNFLKGSLSIPIMEDNFSRSPVLSFRESSSHDIYHIDGDSLTAAYKVESPGLEIPEGLFNGDPMEVMVKMQSKNFIVIKSFLENETYIYMLIQEYVAGEENVNDYHWVINKDTKEEKLIDLGAVAEGSFHDNPQCMSDDNIVYFLGYPILTDNDKYDPAGNPHVIGIDLSRIK